MSVHKPWRPAVRVVFCQKEKEQQQSEDLVSVCITNFNYGRYLPNCLNSLSKQTHKHIDLVIVDDFSQQDRSIEIATGWLKKHGARFHRALLLRHERNQGPSEARNTGFRHALGNYVFVIDADNEAYPRAIARLHSALLSGGFDATYPQLELFGKKTGVGSADIWDVSALYENNYIDVMALVRKSAWEKVDGYSHIDDGWEDYDFWLKFAEAGFTAAYVPEILCRYRVHDHSRTALEAFAAHEHLKLVMNLRHPPPQHRSRSTDHKAGDRSNANMTQSADRGPIRIADGLGDQLAEAFPSSHRKKIEISGASPERKGRPERSRRSRQKGTESVHDDDVRLR